MRKITVIALERACTMLDHLGWPQKFEGRWYWASGGLGCRLGLANKSCDLDDRWHTGQWT